DQETSAIHTQLIGAPIGSEGRVVLGIAEIEDRNSDAALGQELVLHLACEGPTQNEVRPRRGDETAGDRGHHEKREYDSDECRAGSGCGAFQDDDNAPHPSPPIHGLTRGAIKSSGQTTPAFALLTLIEMRAGSSSCPCQSLHQLPASSPLALRK